MSDNPSRPAARFIRVHAELLPENVQVHGTIYGVGPVNSPDRGPGWLPADLLAARNVASGHLSMARRLLDLTRGLTPEEYRKRAQEYNTRAGHALSMLAHEIKCQNGAEIVTALFDQLTTANESGRLIQAGPVSEANAHAAAFAASHQLANELLNGEPLSIGVEDLDRLQILVDREAAGAEWDRYHAAGQGSGSPPGPLFTLDNVAVMSFSGGKQRLLLSALNGKGNVRIVDLLKAIYGSQNSANTQAILKAKERLNETLAKKNMACEVRQEGETLVLSRL
jgi:hypothetical protein